MMRITLPDRPGSLGSVATAMGSVDADINAVEIVEKKSDGSVVDDFIVDLPPNQLPETIVTACQNLVGVRVEWIARYPEGGGLQSDLEALERMTADPPHAAKTLVSLCPVVFRSHWAILIDVSEDAPRSSFSTTLAPDLTPEIATKFAPFDATHRTDLEAEWSPGWGDTTAVVTPLTQDRVIVIGRLGGPAFLDSEIARLHHLAALVK
ncbi:MAG TPA: amino acid-binding protein [Propionibacteriaceae bacterium]|nr:amino acid-binding protein [Propionibacteriaceae bacterium]